MSLRSMSLGLAMSALVLLACRASPALGGPRQIVSPSRYADRESAGAGTTGWAEGRWQEVLPASDFLSLPPGYRFITQMAWRPDGGLRRPITTTIDRLFLRLSTTAVSPPKLSRTFADNIGPNETVVFDGPFAEETGNVGPPGGPKEFDSIIAFERPFEYDPNEGNLLIDLQWTDMSSTSMDLVSLPGRQTQLIWTTNSSSPRGNLEGGGVIFQFEFAPGLQAGDADQDMDFDQFDLIRVQQAGKYLTGQPATWGEGDWNGAPGGYPGRPSEGDGRFNQLDIVAAQQAAVYLTGPYAMTRATDAALAAVPEPSTIVLVVGGFAGLLPFRWRRSRTRWS